jgi:hypothetical protein
MISSFPTPKAVPLITHLLYSHASLKRELLNQGFLSWGAEMFAYEKKCDTIVFWCGIISIMVKYHLMRKGFSLK